MAFEIKEYFTANKPILRRTSTFNSPKNIPNAIPKKFFMIFSKFFFIMIPSVKNRI